MMDVLKWVPLLILVVLILILLIGNIVIVQQSKAYVVERLGAFRTVWGVGLHLKVPFVERVAKKVSLKEQVADFAPQPVITKDNVTMQIDTVLYFQITDPKLYTYGVEHPMSAIENLTATTLRNIIGEMELDHTLTSRDVINGKITAILDEATDKWGIKVNRVEVKNIIPPREIQEAMEKQMKAEREKRAVVAASEGRKLEQINLATGAREAAIAQSEGEKQAEINKAEGQAAATLTLATATAEALRRVAAATQAEGGMNAVNLQVAEKYVEAFSQLAKTNNTLIVPGNLGDISGMIASAMKIVDGAKAQLPPKA